VRQEAAGTPASSDTPSAKDYELTPNAGVAANRDRASNHVQGPLFGVRVIDFTTARSGPTCTRQLADLGADVIRVVRPDALDDDDSDEWNLQRNKRSIILDLKTKEGREIILRLVARADVLVENWRPAVKYRLGLGPDALLKLNPRLVYGSISGFGQHGPYANRPGLDQVVQGMGGLMSVTGPPGSGPWRAGIAITDSATGTFLAEGILAALVARERTGKGQWVHTSLLEVMVNLLDFQAARWLIDGEVPKQVGNQHPTLPAMATFQTADSYLNVAVQSDFERFFTLIGEPDLASDDRFLDAAGRRQNRDALHALLQQAFLRRTTKNWISVLSAQFSCGPVLSIDEVFADPQVGVLNLTETVRRADGQEIEVLRLPLTFSATPADIRLGPRRAGAETGDVLRELGCQPEEIERLAGAGIVGGKFRD
jgi:crotonobetainyl-CoA:carnitine CoA-transferase CaiB-like acyl-CoA transferase